MEHPVMNAIIAMIAAVRERICVAFIGGLLEILGWMFIRIVLLGDVSILTRAEKPVQHC